MFRVVTNRSPKRKRSFMPYQITIIGANRQNQGQAGTNSLNDTGFTHEFFQQKATMHMHVTSAQVRSKGLSKCAPSIPPLNNILRRT